MIQFFHACGHFQYAKCAHIYVQDMIKLKSCNPQAYNEFAEKDASSGVSMRSGKTLKLKYEGIKKTTKKKSAVNRQEMYKTGGGEALKVIFSPEEEKVLAMCSNIKGLEPRNDSDEITALPCDSIQQEEIEIIDSVDVSEECLFTVLVDPEPEEPRGNNEEVNESAIDGLDIWESWKPQSLKRKITPALRKKPNKASLRTKFVELGDSRLELVELQKEIARAELKYQKIEHKLRVQEHELGILGLKNEEKRQEEEHKHRMQQ